MNAIKFITIVPISMSLRGALYYHALNFSKFSIIAFRIIYVNNKKGRPFV